jgi:dihydroorotate dehydrogenase electron transfer subunit
MRTATARIDEITSNERHAARLSCPAGVIPAPGQYALATAQPEENSALAQPIFSAGLCQGGFYAAPPFPPHWRPGTQLIIRGPLGKGFQLPASARFVALLAFGGNPARLLALAGAALAQKAGVALLADTVPQGLPAAIEVSPLAALPDILAWADYLAIDLPRAALAGVLKGIRAAAYAGAGQALIETPIPCAGMGECGACAIAAHKNYLLACKDGPVFDLKTLL